MNEGHWISSSCVIEQNKCVSVFCCHMEPWLKFFFISVILQCEFAPLTLEQWGGNGLSKTWGVAQFDINKLLLLSRAEILHRWLVYVTLQFPVWLENEASCPSQLRGLVISVSETEIFSAPADTNTGRTGVDQVLCQTLTDTVFVILWYVAEKMLKYYFLKSCSASEPAAEGEGTPGGLFVSIMSYSSYFAPLAITTVTSVDADRCNTALYSESTLNNKCIINCPENFSGFVQGCSHLKVTDWR